MSVSVEEVSRMRLLVSRVDAMRSEGFDEDEIASVLTFVHGRLVEPVSIGAHSYTPLDECVVTA
jgi:hypothetical protein